MNLLTFKKAEDGNGYILRLIEPEGKETTTTVTMPYLSVLHAFEANLVEENERVLACSAHSVETTPETLRHGHDPVEGGIVV